MLENQHEGGKASKLSRRERQVMQVLASKPEPATAAEIREGMESPPSYSAVRALLRTMEEKGFITHRQDGPRYVYEPKVSQNSVKKSALLEVLSGFFSGSRLALLEALFDPADGKISKSELDQLSKLVEAAKKKGK